jgi:release factor glutamine methyltransferase
MNEIVKKIIGRPLRRAVQWYLQKPRTYRYREIIVNIPPGVFHPGLFFSTAFLLEFLETQHLTNKNVLELGSGSGLISVMTAKKGAMVTAVDISEPAVKATRENSLKNNAAVTVIHSDLFENIPIGVFDWIVINPPYYPAKPENINEQAWYCGEDHEYFEKLFLNLGNYSAHESYVLMVLSDVCNIVTITSIAAARGFRLERVAEKKIWIDGKNYLYRIRSSE